MNRSRELQLPLRCPLVGYCERWAGTVYLNTYAGKALKPKETLFDRLKKDRELPPDFNARRVASVCDVPLRAIGDESEFGIRLCPEVNLFSSEHRLSSLPKEAISSYRLSKYGDVSCIKHQHFSECLEFIQDNYQTDSKTLGESDVVMHEVSTILLLSANPKDTSKLRLDEEVREIESSIKERSRLRDQFHLVSKVAVRPRDLQRAMLDHRPQFVHFSGHGHSELGISLESEAGYAYPVTADALASLFALYSQSVECVLLNSCYSKEQAQTIAKYVPFVIGMSDEINDRAAIEFAVAFYDAIGNGSNIDFAYRSACVAIQLAGIPQSSVPTLHEGIETDEEGTLGYLETMLREQRWEEADQETARLMILSSGDQLEKEFAMESIGQFPCSQLLKIDDLWKKYSKGKFGFSVQKTMWSRAGCSFDIFADKVGWRSRNTWKKVSALDYRQTALDGHLPSMRWVRIEGWAVGSSYGAHNLASLFERLTSCKCDV